MADDNQLARLRADAKALAARTPQGEWRELADRLVRLIDQAVASAEDAKRARSGGKEHG